jgi:hypothetical protein
MLFGKVVRIHNLPLYQGDFMLLDLILHAVDDFIPLHYALLMLKLSLLSAAERLYLFKFFKALHVDATNPIL